jgi:ferredoxin
MDPANQPPGTGMQPPAREAGSGMSTGAKVGIGVAIGCVAAVAAVALVLAFMGACTCSACSSCCAEMTKAAQQAQELEEREARTLRNVGETVQMGSVAVTVSDAQRQGETVVVTVDLEDQDLTEVSIGPAMFTLEDSHAGTYAIDAHKASMTMQGLEGDTTLAAGEAVTVRAVFTLPAQSTGLVLVVEEPGYGTRTRRFKLGL